MWRKAFSRKRDNKVHHQWDCESTARVMAKDDSTNDWKE